MSHLDALHGLVALLASRKEEWSTWRLQQLFCVSIQGKQESLRLSRKWSRLHLNWTPQGQKECHLTLNDADKGVWELYKTSFDPTIFPNKNICLEKNLALFKKEISSSEKVAPLHLSEIMHLEKGQEAPSEILIENTIYFNNLQKRRVLARPSIPNNT